jgi:hypothetical protein
MSAGDSRRALTVTCQGGSDRDKWIAGRQATTTEESGRRVGWGAELAGRIREKVVMAREGGISRGSWNQCSKRHGSSGELVDPHEPTTGQPQPAEPDVLGHVLGEGASACIVLRGCGHENG